MTVTIFAALPTATPARARRVGAAPVPRVRPLDEVLAAGPAHDDGPADDGSVPVRRVQDELDRLAAALRPVAARLLTAVGDVLAGRRPARHLGTLLAPDALAALVRAAPGPAAVRAGTSRAPSAGGAGGAVRGLRVCAVGLRAVEVAAVVPGHDRVRAVAARLERADDGPADPGRWHLVVLRLG
ncbi:Rv3235 family protein [Actinomycetospora aeridis]|uniref:Rv3235 family protein n=1 Tax=Actinomycetospora aeridis TaxID=3129231 RepID=A0ABU8MZ54_9PSEU